MFNFHRWEYLVSTTLNLSKAFVFLYDLKRALRCKLVHYWPASAAVFLAVWGIIDLVMSRLLLAIKLCSFHGLSDVLQLLSVVFLDLVEEHLCRRLWFLHSFE